LRQTKEPVILSTIVLPSPSVPRRAKSITDYHKIRRRPNHDIQDPEHGGVATELDFVNSYSDVSDALADANHGKYQYELEPIS